MNLRASREFSWYVDRVVILIEMHSSLFECKEMPINIKKCTQTSASSSSHSLSALQWMTHISNDTSRHESVRFVIFRCLLRFVTVRIVVIVELVSSLLWLKLMIHNCQRLYGCVADHHKSKQTSIVDFCQVVVDTYLY